MPSYRTNLQRLEEGVFFGGGQGKGGRSLRKSLSKHLLTTMLMNRDLSDHTQQRIKTQRSLIKSINQMNSNDPQQAAATNPGVRKNLIFRLSHYNI